ncbi:hypothetical protein WI80_13905 [Burkholderia ubonensis]|uniref:gp53-like domain-containing protein n=1 Tax=Burkholderia ubonensis TaxID=101571 RepID=UPI00075930C3|nr:hypothetical protein [Burkholderia ubonensis]KVD09395.1 hypothetical protein WI80_13905 [Burkholderia ubonensis]KVU18949.1 hypothetical protein WK63_07245 [Burkholderia ubonensis]
MSNLIEVDRWEDGIYQLETSDPVIGGPDGIDNLQAKQLANRTQFLKRLLETGQSNLDAHANAVDPHPQYATKADLAQRLAELVGQSPAALDTLKELAEALGNDPNFATTVMNALALKAPIDSPVFAGTPKGPTPPQFDSSTKLATMAAVQRALGNFQAIASVSSAVTLTAADAGKAFTLNTGASVTLPLFSSVQPGASFLFINAGPTMTISRQGADLIFGPSAAQNGSLVGNATGVTLQTGDWCIVTAMVAWEVVAGSPLMTLNNGAFGAVLTTNGYQKLPSGLIIQWGMTGGSGNSTGTVVTLPLAMPNAILQVVASDTGELLYCGGARWSSKTQFNLIVGVSGGSSYTTGTLRWVAIGY